MKQHAHLCAVLNVCMALLAAGVLGLALFGVLRARETTPVSGVQELIHSAEAPESVPEGTDPAGTGQEDPAGSPADFLPTEQRTVLDALEAAFQAEDAQTAGELLADWLDLYEDPLSGWQDLTGWAYVDGILLSGYTGTALAMDGPTRFYYGPLENGVPEGEGLRLAQASTRYESCNYFWLDGTWSEGILTGAAEISLGQTNSYFPDAPPEFMHISCVFDGTAQEIMASASVTQREGTVLQDAYETMTFQYNVSSGAIVPGEWTEDGHGRLLYHSGESLGGYTYHLGIYPDHPPVFQNPYPWGKSYRFPYQDLFGQMPSPM